MPSGRPSNRTAVTATTSVEMSSLLRTAQLASALEPEPDATHGGDVAGTVRVIAELAAQPGNVHVERLGRGPPLGPPDVPHQLLPGDHLARVPDQRPEQVELLGGEFELV